MNDKYIKQIRKALTEIVGLNKLGYDFEIKLVECGFLVSIDFDFWNDEKEKRETFNHLTRYFPRMQFGKNDDQLAHIPFGRDNFGEINA